MPKIDDFETCRRLKTHAPAVPVIFLTAGLRSEMKGYNRIGI
ncbi:MAG TPA: hypothetical protein EYG11_16160 [Candidatus Latescibacteria bacterium]|nr:hypothetical protein [Candidatus Handelsmanbacteria bacterium]HIL10234.1 hypothetical protein [Candidatus Latescibacterota bacterium]